MRAVRRRKAQGESKSINIASLRLQMAISAASDLGCPRRYLCLYDGRALLEFLAGRHFFPL